MSDKGEGEGKGVSDGEAPKLTSPFLARCPLNVGRSISRVRKITLGTCGVVEVEVEFEVEFEVVVEVEIGV